MSAMRVLRDDCVDHLDGTDDSSKSDAQESSSARTSRTTSGGKYLDNGVRMQDTHPRWVSNAADIIK